MSDLHFSSALSTNWITWTPTYGASGSMTFGTVTTNKAVYRREDNIVWIYLQADGTTGGIASTDITFTLPVTAIATHGCFNSNVVDVLNLGGFAKLTSTTVCSVRRYDIGVWGIGAGRIIQVSGFYQV